MSHRKEQFVGAWSLQSWIIESAGKISYPFGKDAKGQILYTADGAMSATVCAATRASLAHSNPRRASDTEKAAAFASYFHYAGAWSLDGDFIVHEVGFSLNPAMRGSSQRRLATFSDPDRLTLSAVESLAEGQDRNHVLDWQRSK